ncbi:MAG: cysteine--tRNA ligase [Candidatus Altimarinota bacterium]
MSLKLYNTLSRKIETFKPLKQDEVKVYYCGPTPYNYAHIGNLRNYLMDDFIVRSLRFLGYKVKTTMNITDIDDKTIRDSQKSGKSLRDFTEYYTHEFFHDCARLSIIPADNIKPISELIDDMGLIINGLIQKGYAYLADDGSIYYSVTKFEKYGNLAHLDFKGMISSVRIDNDEYDKEQVADFALWKAYDKEADGENKWSISVSIDGKRQIIEGRPGWHIECSACNKHFFGDQIDIHMGGVDLIFPHHQNEIAQTEAFTGKEFSKYWLHGGHLLVDNKKMSKSANNFYTLRDILEKMKSGDEKLVCRGFRLMGLQNSYRENFNFTYERLTSAINTIHGVDEMLKRLGRYVGNFIPTEQVRNNHGKLKHPDISREFRDNQQYFMQLFIEKLEDDFDTVSAMTVIFEFQTYVNSGIDTEIFSFEEAKSLIDILRSWDEVLAIFDFSLLENTEIIPEEITKLALDRVDAKIAKNWGEADRIRDELSSKGWKMIDEAGGKWRVEKV